MEAPLAEKNGVLGAMLAQDAPSLSRWVASATVGAIRQRWGRGSDSNGARNNDLPGERLSQTTDFER